jgi:general stress protein 26
MTHHENHHDDHRDHRTEETAKVAGMIKDVRIAMLTHVRPDGRLVSSPMATQDVEFDGDVLFIARRSSDQVRDLSSVEGGAPVNLAYSSGSTWVSVAGRAEVVHDTALLAELWNTFTDAWLEGGPDDPENVLIRVRAETAQYWDSPGAKVTQLANLVKAKVTGSRVEGDQGVVDL